MSFSEKFMRLILAGLILLSLFFTYSIWISPAGRTPSIDSSSQVLNNEQNYTKATDAFLPLRGIWDLDGGHFQTNSENLLATLQARLTESTYGELKIVANSETEAAEYYQLANGVELNYEGPFSLAEYVKVFDIPLDLSGIDDEETITFGKIQLDSDNQKIRFLDYQKHVVYEASISTDFQKIQEIYHQNADRYLTMTPENQLVPRLMQTQDTVRLKRYSYILTTQSYSLFRNAFFQEPEQARGEQDESNSRSFVSGHEELTMDDEDRLVKFSGELPTELADQSLYTQSFSYVSRLGTAVGNLRYFDRQNNQVNYRIFVEGYPIFSQSSKGKMSISIDPAQNDQPDQVEIETSMDTVQVPIPSEDEVELPSSSGMEGQLMAAGVDLSLVQSYIIGYTWQDVDSGNGVYRVVALTPEWYVKFNDQWYTFNELLQGNLVEMGAS
ncbi:YycH family regulatory protein [Enterococcus sp. AZ109]|uniref:YycH family regulatory protein n=1 Tax=Enterococcus sp. AZ109 TaxID=2774634 RepID=UPI003F216B80